MIKLIFFLFFFKVLIKYRVFFKDENNAKIEIAFSSDHPKQFGFKTKTSKDRTKLHKW